MTQRVFSEEKTTSRPADEAPARNDNGTRIEQIGQIKTDLG